MLCVYVGVGPRALTLSPAVVGHVLNPGGDLIAEGAGPSANLKTKILHFKSGGTGGYFELQAGTIAC
jgi:hypothetical protein